MSEIDWELRPYEASDEAAVDALLRASFDSPAEAELVVQLRKDSDAEIELVADSEGEILGYVILSRMIAPERALGLGPVATTEPHRGTGIASTLIESGLALATANDWLSVFLLGDPAFYERFGFSVDDADAFQGAFAGPYLQVAFLDEEEGPRKGEVTYAKAFARFESAD
ncbi:N-acetyltransferase [Parvularcula sp. ZS-1/3]|uniref:N-acetyltransferase n=1 Tax=Parvularcula mediterranea TaxID=2732508 RepID=A0A7Y3W5Q1_9PROT|nr:N-acetyltransferase [Parvularcula mediterranea]NNU17000.1 N-acetyltransferase [Parvularcula mediterranea]